MTRLRPSTRRLLDHYQRKATIRPMPRGRFGARLTMWRIFPC